MLKSSFTSSKHLQVNRPVKCIKNWEYNIKFRGWNINHIYRLKCMIVINVSCMGLKHAFNVH